MSSQVPHRSGPLKQQNKFHKTGRHRSNREVYKVAKVRVSHLGPELRRKKNELRRHEKRNQILQVRKSKREESLNEKRGLGSADHPPLLVGIFPLSSEGFDTPVTNDFLQALIQADSQAVVQTSESGQISSVFVPRFKTRYQFVNVDPLDLYATLDFVKLADVIIFLHPHIAITGKGADEELKSYFQSNSAFQALYSHSLPTTIHVAYATDYLPIKKRAEVKRSLTQCIEYMFPDEKLHMIDKPSDGLQFMHQIANCKRRKICFRKHRWQIMSENFDFSTVTESAGSLKVYGYVRNQPLNVNGIVHIPGWGDYQMSQVEVIQDPMKQKRKFNTSGVDCIMDDSLVLKSDPLVQESLQIENEIDPMEGEQTFPTEEEIAAAQLKPKKVVRRVPKGTSEYQSTWIVDSDQEEVEDADDDGNPEDDIESGSDDSEYEDINATMQPADVQDSSSEHESEEEETDEQMSVAESAITENYDAKYSAEQEREMLKNLKKEADEDEEFRDEIDTPMDIPARIRFARYRGLKSFHKSEWDPKENLPEDYSRIFQFENFARTRKRIFNSLQDNEDSADLVPVGKYVCLTICNVPKEVPEYFKLNPKHSLVLIGMLPHEQKMSLVNTVIKRTSNFEDPIKSKDSLIFHVGCRRYVVNPIFSAHTNGDKFKYERFLRHDPLVASFYAPITYPPASVLVFKQDNESGSHILVATGSVLSVNPDRVVTKRIILSGFPFKINKKYSTVRFMFFNRDDIMWFKPVELRSKYGRKGHILEPLGTRGHMKCKFDRQLKADDTVTMSLYKRIFPKWNYQPFVLNPARALTSEEQIEKEIEHEMKD